MDVLTPTATVRRHLLLLALFGLASWGVPTAAQNEWHRGADALLAIDQNRTTVIDRIVTQWGEPLAQSSVRLSSEQLRTMLNGLRADHLLAASRVS